MCNISGAKNSPPKSIEEFAQRYDMRDIIRFMTKERDFTLKTLVRSRDAHNMEMISNANKYAMTCLVFEPLL